ncbi:MAG TPA: LLM class flavin-dependent oxidoreductase [Candidatus Baltobacterales bacterium]|nr:LLM class flavin-dependent oxidoreductase [Candidatus Baltobacterales bacterium]
MRLGLGPVGLKSATRSSLERLASQALAASFDSVWVEESRAEGAGGGLAAAAMLAQSTPLRVGAAVDTGLYHPLHLAEDIAVADLACQGRIEVLLRLSSAATEKYAAPVSRAALEEHVTVLGRALSGAHIQWNGKHLRVPGRLEANQPAPQRLALNPRPAQPVVPVWVEAVEPWMAELARTLGFGVAVRWGTEADVPSPTGRWPGMVLCSGDAQAAPLLAAAGEHAGYFLVAATTAEQVAAAGRRLAGPLRMPGFPAWVNSGE